MKLSGFLLTWFMVISIAPGFGSDILPEKTCDNGFSSTLDITSKNQGCYNYQLTVFYDGSGKDKLSNMTVKLPCGTVGSISNNIGWTVESILADVDSDLSEIKIDNIQDFGGRNGSASFIVNFSLCAEELTCACELASLNAEISYQTRKGNRGNPGNGRADNPGKGNKKKKDNREKKDLKKDNPGKGSKGKDKNGCIEYETVTVAEPLACNTPKAEITGPNGAIEMQFCSGSSEDLTITISENDEAPWHVVYTNGVENFDVDISTTPYALKVTEPGTYALVSVSDADGNEGSVSGSVAVTHIETPTAIISGDATVCSGEGELTIQLTGAAPWTVNYSDGAQTYEVKTSDYTYTFAAKEGTYNLVSVTDAACTGSVSGSATVTTAEVPTATLSEGGSICEGESATINVILTGTSPWTITYTDGSSTFDQEISSPAYSFQANQIGTYTLVDVKDAICNGTVSGSATVSMKEPIIGNIYIENEYCPGRTIYLASSVQDNGYTYQWTTTGSGELSFADRNKAAYKIGSEEGFISFSLLVSNGCNTSELVASTTIVGVNADFTVSPEPNAGQLIANTNYNFSANMKDADTYLWDFNGTAYRSSEVDYLIKDSYYIISLQVSKNGCYVKGFKQFETITEASTVYVSNTSNLSTGETEVKVHGDNLAETNFSFEIYDPNGAKIYGTNDLNEAKFIGWSSIGYEDGVFNYILKGQYIDGESIALTGKILVN